MSVVSIHGRDAGAFAKSILHQLLEGGHLAGRDADGGNVLQLSVDDWLLDELCAFDTDSAELEDADGEAEPDGEVDGQAMVPDLVPLKRIVRASRLARGPALGVLCESEPDEQVAGPATVLDFVPPKRIDRASRLARGPVLGLLLMTAAPGESHADQAAVIAPLPMSTTQTAPQYCSLLEPVVHETLQPAEGAVEAAE